MLIRWMFSCKNKRAALKSTLVGTPLFVVVSAVRVTVRLTVLQPSLLSVDYV